MWCWSLGLWHKDLLVYVIDTEFSNHYTIADPDAMFMASLSSSQLLLGQQGGTIMGMLNNGHPLIAMATLMYSNIGLQEVS